MPYNYKKMYFQRQRICYELLLGEEAKESFCSAGCPTQRAKARRVQGQLGEDGVGLSLMTRGLGGAGEGQAWVHWAEGLGFPPRVMGMGRAEAMPAPWAC